MTDRNAIRRLGHGLLMMIGRGRVRVVDDSGVIQTIQLQLDQLNLRDNTKRVAEFGFASNPPPGSDAVMIFIGGQRSNGVIIGTNDQSSRLRGLKSGEAAIYDALGRYVWLQNDGGIVVEAKGAPVTVNGATDVTIHASAKVMLDTPELHVSGKITADGDISAAGDVSDATRSMASDRSIYNDHTHADPQGGISDPPSQQE